jgi:tRNA pseudouridine38-40 synthase
MVVEYDGTAFSGWQSQGASPIRTVQGTLEQVLSLVLQERIVLGVAGRTDAGVTPRARSRASSPRARSRSTGSPVRSRDSCRPTSRRVSWRSCPRDSTRASRQSSGATCTGCSMRRGRCLSRQAWWPWMRLDARALTEAYRPLLGEHDFAAFRGRATRRSGRRPTGAAG